VLQACVRSGKTLAQLLEGVQLFPQTLINVRLQPGQDWQAHTGLRQTMQAVEAELGQSGRILIRPSGTEPVLRIMVEAQDGEQARRCAERLADTLKAN
jgi:phosphoglucosamine mutase